MKSVRNSARALALFGVDRPSLSVTDVSVALDISMSVSSRLLATLRSEGLLEQDEARRYRPGIVANQLGLLYRSHNKLPELVTQAARELTTQTGLTTWTSVLSQTDALLLSRFAVPSQHQFQVDPGSRLPAHACASGKALLARLTDEEIGRMYSSPTLPARTKKSISSLTHLMGDLALVRMRGWSEVNEELFLGIRSLGVAVQGPNDPTPMSISISFPTSRFDDASVKEVAGRLIASCRAVGRRVGDPYWLARADEAAGAHVDARLERKTAARPAARQAAKGDRDRNPRHAVRGRARDGAVQGNTRRAKT